MAERVATGRILPTAFQLRMARSALKISVEELGRRAGVSERTIRRIESEWAAPNVTSDILLRLQSYFESEGMTFIPEIGDERGPGVCWGRYPGRALPDRNPAKDGRN